MKIGICGGTFDPFHRGHLEPILAVREPMEWSIVIYMPAWQQPFKTDRLSASAYHRFAMAVLGTEEFEGLFVSQRELERGSVSYTVDTLEQLRQTYPEATLDWIIGDDNVPKLGEWKNIDHIFELANFAVLSRSRGRDDAPEPFRGRITTAAARATHGGIVFAHNQTIPISSTEVRRRIRAGEPIDDLVDPRVEHHIQHYGLYREAQQ